MEEATERLIIGSLNRYRPGGLSVSHNPVIHTDVEETRLELQRLRARHPDVDFQAFKLPLDFPVQPFEFPD